MKKEENTGSCSQITRRSQTIQGHREHIPEFRLNLMEMKQQGRILSCEMAHPETTFELLLGCSVSTGQ